ncbi:sialidase family protein [Ideonella sp.]|uniref:sialidase family protein n=1 Tax=Ideonella sp. TaxID=1929293 RepID=UPI0035AF8A67
MKASMKIRLAALALGVAGAAGPAWAKDTLVYREGRGRTLMAVDAQRPDHLAISGHVSHCKTGQAVHVSADAASNWALHCLPEVGDWYWMVQTPSVTFDAAGGLLAAGAVLGDADTSALFVTRSADQGATWDPWRYVASPSSTHGGLTDAYVHVDDRPNSPYRGTTYVTYTAWEEEGAQIRVAVSPNGGSSWQSHKAMPTFEGPVSPGSLAIGHNGRLNLVYATCSDWDCTAYPASIYFVQSDDGGASWSLPVGFLEAGLPAGRGWGNLPGTDVRLKFEPSLAVDNSHGPHRGELYVAVPTFADGRLVVMTTRSEDGGQHWSDPQPVAPAAGDQFMPKISVNRRGEMAVTWLDRRNDPQGLRYQPMIAFSADGGRSFQPPQLLDDDLTDPRLQTSDLEASATHAWAGSRVQAAFLGQGQNPRLTTRVNHARP